ncbi:MAG: short-chain dehydrogenase [Bacteroidota bacterium]|nr:short-chain dehydrogenase [Bacteroidota bacterium]MDP4245244.1 short-chain dehydrogenase [Bacteroidota bacterium]MDP4255852.1 short-chain dehydrogenase [Bacteroidota bacterium]MDP4260300.1 short-chain dehydrogenase [Bacteroidota bacterium]
MTSEQIEKFFANNPDNGGQAIKIFFKARNTVEGVFIRNADYVELKGKNFWRIVTLKNFESYRNSKDVNLTRIFNGAEFTKLSQGAK